jgi:two-component system, NarL family, sensor kinase
LNGRGRPDRRQSRAAEALRIEERERRRLAQELHDDAIQSLLAAQLGLRQARRGDLETLDDVEEAIARTIDRLRGAIVDLHPPALQYAGLPEAIRQMADQQARLGPVSVTVLVDRVPRTVHDRIVFVIARELLSNVVRHADAASAIVRLRHREGFVVLEVEDDGVGISPAAQRRARDDGHLGLVSSRERVEALGGTFTIGRSASGGALVRAELPARRAEDRLATGY